MNLSTPLAGMRLAHPFLLASGPLSHDGEAIVRAHRAGASAIVTKTISRTPAVDPVPSIVLEQAETLLNAERWSTLSSETWIERDIPLAVESGAVVIASVGLAPLDVAALASELESAGVSALEVVSYDESAVAGMVREAVKRVRIPVIAKVSVNWQDPVAAATACADLGAAAITASDSLGPALRIDLGTRRPRLGSASGWLSGRSLFPVVLHLIARLSAVLPRSVPIIGTGGVTSADAAIEMMMAGATAVGLCTAPILHGLSSFETLPEQLARRLNDLGFDAGFDCIGAAHLRDPHPSRLPSLSWDPAACTHCNLCVRLCPYGARSSSDPLHVGDACHRCGLCVSACPAGALTWAAAGTDGLTQDQGALR